MTSQMNADRAIEMQTHDSASRATILVVEDDALIRMLGADMLDDAGYQVLEAATADEAILILQSAVDINLLFSDIDMPGTMDGMALANMVHERWPNIRLLMTSGHHFISDEDVPDHGHFIPKPYTSETVMKEINELLSVGD